MVDFPSLHQLNNLWYLNLYGCSNVTKFPLTSGNIEDLILSETAIQEVPSSIQSLTKLIQLELSNCRKLKHIPSGICKFKSLNLQGCSGLEAFPEILETMEFLESLFLIGTAIKELPTSIEHLNGLQRLDLSDCKNLEMLPSSICNLTSLQFLYLSNCSKLDKLPDNLGNLTSLKHLTVRGAAVSQLPSSITRLENLERLYLDNCNLMEIPEDIGCLSSLKELVLVGNKFESLPKSIKHLSKLEYLSIRECNRLRSLTEFPVTLKSLEAINCKQLCQALPDASEFKLCIHSKRLDLVHFLFNNCFNLDHKAVSNVIEESLKVISLLNLNTLFLLISLSHPL